MATNIDFKLASKLFSYDQDSGILSEKTKRNGCKFDVGDPVGALHKCGGRQKKEYLRFKFSKKLVYAHRVIWVLMTGEQPKCIDHIDGDGLNNKWSNLRSVDHRENLKNQKRHSTNTSGITGVTYRKDTRMWRSRIVVDGLSFHLGNFSYKFEAICVRKVAELRHGFIGN